MDESTDYYHSASAGGRLHRRVFTPHGVSVGQLNGVVLLVHGLGDHMGCHEKAARMFCRQGLIAAGVDWPGHGLSYGVRGHSREVGSLLKLISESLTDLRSRLPKGAPVGLYAHSAGAFVLLQFLRQQALLGSESKNKPSSFPFVWLSSPLLRPTHGQSFLKIKIGKWLSKIAPGLRFDTGVRSDRCYPADLETGLRQDDPLKHHKISLAFGSDLMARSAYLAECAQAFSEPSRLYISQGGADQICPPEFSQQFFDLVPLAQADKVYRLFPGVLHEPLNDPIAPDLLVDLGHWVAESLSEVSGKACKSQ